MQIGFGQSVGLAHIDVVGHTQIFEHLLRHLGKDGRGNAVAVVGALGIVHNHGHGISLDC